MKNKLIAACFAVFSAFYSCDDACGCEMVKCEVEVKDSSDFVVRNFSIDEFCQGEAITDKRTKNAVGLIHVLVPSSGENDLRFMIDLRLPKKVLDQKTKFDCELPYSLRRIDVENSDKGQLQMSIMLHDLLKTCGFETADGQKTQIFNQLNQNDYAPAALISFKKTQIWTPEIKGAYITLTERPTETVRSTNEFAVVVNCLGMKFGYWCDLDGLKDSKDLDWEALGPYKTDEL